MMPRSPLVASSPMQMQRRQSTGNSPAMPDRPQSVENPPTPRTPHTPHSFVQQSANLATPGDQQQILQQIPQQISQEQVSSSEHAIRGGGNPHNPLNPVPSSNSTRGGGNSKNPLSPVPSSIPSRGGGNFRNPLNPIPFPNFGRFGYFKLGLRGGSPMWSSKTAESSKSSSASTGPDLSQEEKPNTSMHRKPTKIGSLVCVDYNDFDDDSHTPPQTPPTNLEAKQGSQPSSLHSSTLENGPLPLESPGEKLEQLPDTTDYDDDKTIVNTEVTLSSAAQRDSDDITVIEHFGDSELVDVISGSLESDMHEEYVLFEPEIVVDLSADSNDSLCHALVNADTSQGDLVQILEIENVESQVEDPMLSDDDLADTRNKKSLRLDIVRTLQSGKKLVAVTDTPESPDQEELRVDPSPGSYLDNSPEQDLMVSLVGESEVVIIDPMTKSPEDNLSKGSCDDDTDKTDGTNILIDVSRASTVAEGLIDDSIKPSQEDSKQSDKSPNFTFSEQSSYNQNTSSTARDTINSTVSISKSLISTGTTTIFSSSNAILTSTNSHPQVSAQVSATKSKALSQESSLNIFGSQKGVSVPLASIVADAKLAARLNQTALENISNKQQNKLDMKISEIPKTTSFTTISTVQSGFFSSSDVETSSKPTKLILTVQPTSVTLSPKMSIPDLKKNTLKIIEKQAEESNVKRKKEEELNQTKIKNQSGSTISSTLVTKEKKNDLLNPTDELESMLEAIHNPVETILENECKSEVATTATLKRISPVTDDLSLVNILENDAEPVENDKEENSNSEIQKSVNKSKEIRDKETDNAKDTSSKDKTAEELELENAKPYLQLSCLNEEKTLMEESSDEILDILQNIMSKPDMSNSSEMKSSLIYQMPTPLTTLPLNILQDSLMDQESLENDQLPSSDNKNQVKSQNFEAKKSPSAPNQTVAQLQKNTTTVPHLSPLSKPNELTSHVVNVSQQLRTLLSSLHTNQTTGNQSDAVTVCSVNTGSVISPTNTLSTLNASTSNVSTLSRSDQNRLPTSLNTNIAKETGLALKETAKDSGGMSTGKDDQVFRVTITSTTALQSGNSSSLATTTSSLIMTSKTITTSISIASNAMLNAMLARSSLKPSTAGVHGRSNTIPTQSGNLLSSMLPSTSIQRSQPANLQTILQVSSATSRVLANSTSTVTSPMQNVRTIASPLSTPSILQSTLSQAPNHLLTSNHGQHKSPNLLAIDTKNNDLDNQSVTSKRDPESGNIQEKTSGRETDSSKSSTNSLRLEESQNVLLKQLLQNTAYATTSASSQGPSLPIVPSLEAQLARPVPPTPPSLLPQLLNETPMAKAPIAKQVLARETSFLSSHSVTPMRIQSSPTKEEPPKPPPPLPASLPTTQQRTQVDTLKQQQQQQQPANQAIKTALSDSSGNQQLVSSVSPLPTTTTTTTTIVARTSPKSSEVQYS